GSELQAVLDTLDPALVAEYGPGAMSYIDLFGSAYVGDDQGVCAAPEALLSFSDSDGDWEARLELTSYFQFIGGIEPILVALTPECRIGLSAGDPAAALSSEA